VHFVVHFNSESEKHELKVDMIAFTLRYGVVIMPGADRGGAIPQKLGG